MYQKSSRSPCSWHPMSLENDSRRITPRHEESVPVCDSCSGVPSVSGLPEVLLSLQRFHLMQVRMAPNSPTVDRVNVLFHVEVTP